MFGSTEIVRSTIQSSWSASVTPGQQQRRDVQSGTAATPEIVQVSTSQERIDATSTLQIGLGKAYS